MSSRLIAHSLPRFTASSCILLNPLDHPRSERQLPVRAGGLVPFKHDPTATQGEHRQAGRETHGQGSPSFVGSAVKCDGWFRIGMPWATLAGLAGFDVMLLETLDSLADARVDFSRNRGTRRSLIVPSVTTNGARRLWPQGKRKQFPRSRARLWVWRPL